MANYYPLPVTTDERVVFFGRTYVCLFICGSVHQNGQIYSQLKTKMFHIGLSIAPLHLYVSRGYVPTVDVKVLDAHQYFRCLI